MFIHMCERALPTTLGNGDFAMRVPAECLQGAPLASDEKAN
jgi:hypothetical protein